MPRRGKQRTKASRPARPRKAGAAKARSKAKSKSKPKAKAKRAAPSSNRGLNPAAPPSKRLAPSTARPARKPSKAGPRRARTRAPFSFAAVDMPRPEVDALLVKVYQYAARELHDQEERARARRQPDDPERADRYANVRSDLIQALVLWEQRHGTSR